MKKLKIDSNFLSSLFNEPIGTEVSLLEFSDLVSAMNDYNKMLNNLLPDRKSLDLTYKALCKELKKEK